MTVHLWAIGAVYHYQGVASEEDVILESVNEGGELVSVRPVRKSCVTGFSDIKCRFTGPTHIPCPVCGELQIVRETPHNQITLAEHLDRCHA